MQPGPEIRIVGGVDHAHAAVTEDADLKVALYLVAERTTLPPATSNTGR